MATLSEAQAQLTAWENASLATASGKSYSISAGGSDRQLTRNNAEEIVRMINHWQGVVNALTASAAGSNSPASLACWNNCT